MPIRFRCAYCNQLMGISTRKAGTVVKCPKCAGEIIVPSPDSVQAPEESPQQNAAPPVEQSATAAPGAASAFEGKEFEDFFKEAANGSVGATAAVRTETAPPAVAQESAANPPSPPPSVPLPRRGLLLTLPALVVSVVVILLLFILVFVLGIVLGRQTAPPASSVSVSWGRLPACRVSLRQAGSLPHESRYLRHCPPAGTSVNVGAFDFFVARRL